MTWPWIEIPRLDYTGRAVWVAVAGEVKGALVLQDIVAAETGGFAAALRAYGAERVVLATGDNEEREAKRVADIIGTTDYHFGCTPADKAALVKRLQAYGKVAMVGDGVNDAPALAAANVGIAIGGYKNINLAILSSDIVILGKDAKSVVTILALSKRMREIIRQNYTWAISFNTVGLALVTFGFLTPVLAAFLHHISSIFVVANATRLYLEDTEIMRPADRWFAAWRSALSHSVDQIRAIFIERPPVIKPLSRVAPKENRKQTMSSKRRKSIIHIDEALDSSGREWLVTKLRGCEFIDRYIRKPMRG